MVPSTVVMLREGSFALAFLGRVRKVQESPFVVDSGRKSFALKRILEAGLVILPGMIERVAGRLRHNSQSVISGANQIKREINQRAPWKERYDTSGRAEPPFRRL